jgi:HlyD family secretion protein
MGKKRWWIFLVLLVAAAGSWIYWRADADQGPAYRFANVERGDIEATVSATGALSAVTTVQVGTQVSGQVSAIHADFNDKVTKGQLLARIDPVIPQQAVEEALAGIQRSQAQFDAAKRENERNQKLFDQGLLPESELTGYVSTYEVAKANLTSARVALDRARRNLEYTSIHSPIDGVIVERNVDVGQTVAASLSAPQLFLIANDLSRMQILASVGESDIGAIVDGQPVRFTVQTYPDEHFRGTVRQVRLQSKTTENVVNYTVVIEVENEAGRLLPGMTATVDFLTGSARDVLIVPNAALRFRPTEAMLAEVMARRQAATTGGAETPPAPGDAARADRRPGDAADPEARARWRARQERRDGSQPAGGGPDAGTGGGLGGRPGAGSMLWYVGDDGQLATVRVRTGLSDGQRTEVRGERLTEGMQVIVGLLQSPEEQRGAPVSGPFQGPAPQGGNRFRGPGGF